MRRKGKRKIKLFYVFFPLVLLVICYFASGILYNLLNSFISATGLTKTNAIVKPYLDDTSVSDFRTELAKKSYSIESIHENPSSGIIEATLNGDVIVVFSRYKDVQWQIASLQSILSRLTIEHKRPKKIDFSFDKTIVKL